jgi:hypothetical protein
MGKKPSEIYAVIGAFFVACPPQIVAVFSGEP